MDHSGGVPRVDRSLETVVGAIDALTEVQDEGPGVVLTLGGLVVSGTRSSRTGSGLMRWSMRPVPRSWYTPAVLSTTSTVAGRGCSRASPSHWCRPATSIERPDRQPNASLTGFSAFLASSAARTTSTCVRPAWSLPGSARCRSAGMHSRGRLSEVSGWSFGHLSADTSAPPGQTNPSHP